MQTFAAYSAAREAAERIVKELCGRLPSGPALTATQSRDALAAFATPAKPLSSPTGGGTSLAWGRVGICRGVRQVERAHPAARPSKGFMQTVASVQRKDIKQAVADFIAAPIIRAPSPLKASARRKLSAKYAYNRARFAQQICGTIPGTAVC